MKHFTALLRSCYGVSFNVHHCISGHVLILAMKQQLEKRASAMAWQQTFRL